MRVISIKKEFAGRVANGEIRQVILSTRKKAIEEGERLYLKCGGEYLLNTVSENKSLVSINDVEVSNKTGQISIPCKAVHIVEIIAAKDDRPEAMFLDFTDLSDQDAEQIAQQCGFDNFNVMLDYFKEVYGLPFVGLLVRW